MVSAQRPASLLRRLGAICYDTLLLVAVLFIAGLPLPLIPESLRAEDWMRHATFGYLLGVSFLFFGWFWTHGGQTLGMRAWRLRVVSADNGTVDWRAAALRFAGSLLSWLCLGLGFIWSLFDRQHLAWHDRLSGTRVVHISRSLVTEQQHAGGQEHDGRQQRAQ